MADYVIGGEAGGFAQFGADALAFLVCEGLGDGGFGGAGQIDPAGDGSGGEVGIRLMLTVLRRAFTS